MYNNKNKDAETVIVLNKDGTQISTTNSNRAIRQLCDNKAEVVSKNPLTIRLLNQVEVDADE